MEIHFSTTSAAGIIPRATDVQDRRASDTVASGQPLSRKDEEDRVSLSPEAREYSRSRSSEESNSAKTSGASYAEELTADELSELMELKARDREVRTHEQMHLSTAGRYAAGGPSFTYQKGPDGQRYAVSGEVPIDTSKESTPEETILKMETIQRAALAPGEPSAADRQIAAQAAMEAAQARQEVLLQRQEAKDASRNPGVSSESEQNATGNSNNDQTPSAPATSSIGPMIAAYSSMQAQGER